MATSSLKIALLGAVSLLPATAHAADLWTEPAGGWAGFYAGSIVGYGWSQFDTGSGAASGGGDIDGTTGGGLLGYSWQSGNFVYGLEGDITLHELRGVTDDGTFPAAEVDTMYSARLRARLGYDLGWALPFVAAGGVMNESYIRSAADGFDGDVQRLFGWTAGAGVDFKVHVPYVELLLGPLVLRAEYVYEDFGSEPFSVTGGIDAEQSTHFVRGAVIWRPGEVGGSFSRSANASVDWSGAYGGVMVGYGAMDLETEGAGISDTIDADGVVGGLYLGRNFMFGNWVVGYEGALLLGNIEGNGAQPGAADVEFRTNIQADARLRVGYAMGAFLPFVAGGAAWTRSEQETSLGEQRGRVPAELWTVGAGLDYQLTDAISVRGEYVYASSFDSQTTNFGGVPADQDLELHEVRFGTAYHF
ncbi:outer membrane protein [Terrihabitans sp. B22-R8]|uniref:outer membrane protein n=1 Tax=Terrihabitans sp. B22-R8 TaxID=3425128 RepID=UPI00403CA211